MKEKIAVLSAVLLLVTLTGCNNIPQKDQEPEPFSFSESSENTSESDTLPAEEQAQEVEREPEATQSIELAEEKETEAESSNALTVAVDSGKSTEPTTTPKNEQLSVTGGQEAQNSIPETPTPTPSMTEAADNSTPEPAAPTVTVHPTSKVTPREPDFDIDYWISYAKSYAQSVGLTLNSEAIYCWDNPIAAGTKCKYTERDIIACLNRYAYDEEITDVWIWAEKTGENAYEIYIGYA